jgi:transposase
MLRRRSRFAGRPATRVSKMLSRHGRVWERGTWTQAHRAWLARQQFGRPASQTALADHLAAVDRDAERKASLACELSWTPECDAFWPAVSRLRGCAAFRGIDTLTALGLRLEVGCDWERFAGARQFAAWLRLTPSLHQAGGSATQGQITKPGRATRADCWSSPPGTTAVSPISGRRSRPARTASPSL